MLAAVLPPLDPVSAELLRPLVLAVILGSVALAPPEIDDHEPPVASVEVPAMPPVPKPPTELLPPNEVADPPPDDACGSVPPRVELAPLPNELRPPVAPPVADPVFAAPPEPPRAAVLVVFAVPPNEITTDEMPPVELLPPLEALRTRSAQLK